MKTPVGLAKRRRAGISAVRIKWVRLWVQRHTGERGWKKSGRGYDNILRLDLGGKGGLSLPWIGRKSFDCNGLDRRGRKPARPGP